jgi:hypothetical protein
MVATMTKPSKTTTAAKCYTSEQVNDRFLVMLPSIRQNARKAFCGYNADKREEAEQAIVALAFVIHRNLALKGRLDDSFPAPISKYAIGKYREGRSVGVTASSTEVTSPYCQHLGRSKIKHFGLAEGITDSFETEMTAADARCPPDKAAQFRLDFLQGWLASQTPKDKAIIRDLAMGESQSETARRHGITPACVNQYRKRYSRSWAEFIREKKKTA